MNSAGRAPLHDVVHDFLVTIPDQPWRRARYEALLENLCAHLGAELGYSAPLTALTHERVHTWLQGLSSEQRTFAEGALVSFADYLVKWGWVAAHPLRQPQAI